MAPFESGRRLCVLFEAGRTRFCVEATSVTEVAAAPEDDEVRGPLQLTDLSGIFGGAPEVRPGFGVVLDVSPTLALRVRKILEIADVSRDTFFHLPPGLGAALPALLRGAVLHAGQVFLELAVDALPARPAQGVTPPPRPVHFSAQPPDRALVFESQGNLFGVPLPFVLQIASGLDAFCPLPTLGGPVAGVLPHAQALWPVFSTPGLLGGEATVEPLFVLSELAGQMVALCAQRALGVHQGFTDAQDRGLFRATTLDRPVLFLDLHRMFS